MTFISNNTAGPAKQYYTCVICKDNTGTATISDDGIYRCDKCRDELESVYCH